MLERFFLLEEKNHNYPSLIGFSFLSGIIGFFMASIVFPTQSNILSVFFASVPLIYSLTSQFLDDEAENLPHLPEVETYLSIFTGLAIAFAVLSSYFPKSFDLQESLLGSTGAAVDPASFTTIISNNLTVFSLILLVSLLIGSSGAFILSWNASVFGVFASRIFSSDPFLILAYLPHSLFEMSGFVIAGISGSLISGAVYRRHSEKEKWNDYIKLVAAGTACILIGAILEAF